MIVLRKDLWLLASLLFIAELATVHGIDHHPKREVSGNSLYGLHSTTRELQSTSCGQILCATSPNYPFQAIDQVVERAQDLLRPYQDPNSMLRKSIAPMAAHYLSTLQVVENNHNVREPDGCDHHVKTFLPQEGYSVSDERAYYIVNVHYYSQRVHSVICVSSGALCNNGSLKSTCHQADRVEKLLILPIKNQFHVSNFRVKSFVVPNGCVCSRTNNFNVIPLM